MRKLSKVNPVEKKLISRFIKNLNEKNYSTANKYLKKIVEVKLNKKLSKIINNF
jgi:hypothetical protein